MDSHSDNAKNQQRKVLLYSGIHMGKVSCLFLYRSHPSLVRKEFLV